MKPNGYIISVGLLTIFIIGIISCATTQKNQAIEQARNALLVAQQNPVVQQEAAVTLDEAREQFNMAEALWKEGAEERKIEHQAYLAKQTAAIAVETAQARAAEKVVKQAQAERNQIRIEARSRETKMVREDLNYAQSRAETLEEEIKELRAAKTKRGLVLTLGDILFDYNKSELNPGAYRSVDRLARFLLNHQERNVLIEGFTDSKGSEEYNRRLSESRTQALRIALIQRGVEKGRIQARGYGEAFPVASNDTSGGRAQNRRVEVIISDANGAIPERES